MFRTVRDNLFAALFPQLCFCCNAKLTSPSMGNACADCWTATIIFTGSEVLCTKCGKPGTFAKQPKCSQCDGHEYESARSVGVYSFALRASVVGLKTQPHLPPRLCKLLIEAMKKNELADADLIVPVPLSKQRKLERGFNQAEIVSRKLSGKSGIPADSHSLIRTKHSPIHRAGMDEKARDISVRDSFDVVRPKLIDGRSILLVDDVFTSGATASACAAALKRHGAGEVNVFTIARAVLR